MPHIGCPNDCLFCNQHTISGTGEFRVETVRAQIESALATNPPRPCQIAFFGGSFTGIDRSLMTKLLEIAGEYIKTGEVDSVRISTRPDYINEEILDILKEYKVKNIELGIQSTSDRVLTLNRRGHTSRDSKSAMRLVVQSGFSLTGQMMTGMYGATPEDEVETARAICECGATSARIYPTVTFKKTGLAELFLSGEYTPPTLDESVERASRVYEEFERHGVDVIRIGLQSAEGLHSDEVLSGEYHDAMGELVLSRVLLSKMREQAREMTGDELIFEVPRHMLSQYIGQKRCNILALEKEFNKKVRIWGI